MNGISRTALTLIIAASAATAGCSEFIRQDRSPVTLVIDRLEGSSGADESDTFSGTLRSDVITGGGTFNDSGRVTLRLIMKDLLEAPSAVNAVTVNRYRVTFRRSDGRNTPGVDVPQPFDSAITVTVAPGQTATATFELVRHTAKEEAPLRALATNVAVTVATIADVTFFGRDQVGNELSATGSMGGESMMITS